VTHGHEHADETAVNFEQARADFEAAWANDLPKCTSDDFEEYRRQLHGQRGSTPCTTPGQNADVVAERPIAVLLRRCHRYCQYRPTRLRGAHDR
jgi:hypothetical protein